MSHFFLRHRCVKRATESMERTDWSKRWFEQGVTWCTASPRAIRSHQGSRENRNTVMTLPCAAESHEKQIGWEYKMHGLQTALQGWCVEFSAGFAVGQLWPLDAPMMINSFNECKGTNFFQVKTIISSGCDFSKGELLLQRLVCDIIKWSFAPTKQLNS